MKACARQAPGEEMHEYSPPPLAIYRWRVDVLPERVWGQQQLLARRLRRRCPPLSQPRASYAPICALFRTRPTLVGEDRPSSASRASSGASSSSGGASPMLPPAPSWQPPRPRPTPTPSRAHPSRRGGFFACPPSIRGAGRWLGLSPGELAPQPAAERRCKIEAARPLRAACPAGARMVP